MTTMTPAQVLTVAAIGGAAGVLTVAALALLAAALYRAIAHLPEWRQQWRDRRARREVDRITALYDLPAHDPRDPR
ncbi:hypothetical protein [Streptomyces antibioticus]|uniref:hypothetical protein n=1 Tax=Streptomyces antibioticus TaxID=1890 RepID=UPI003D75BE4C